MCEGAAERLLFPFLSPIHSLLLSIQSNQPAGFKRQSGLQGEARGDCNPFQLGIVAHARVCIGFPLDISCIHRSAAPHFQTFKGFAVDRVLYCKLCLPFVKLNIGGMQSKPARLRLETIASSLSLSLSSHLQSSASRPSRLPVYPFDHSASSFHSRFEETPLFPAFLSSTITTWLSSRKEGEKEKQGRLGKDEFGVASEGLLVGPLAVDTAVVAERLGIRSHRTLAAAAASALAAHPLAPSSPPSVLSDSTSLASTPCLASSRLPRQPLPARSKQAASRHGRTYAECLDQVCAAKGWDWNMHSSD